MSDAELFALVAGGSEAAFRVLWSRYGGAVYSTCRAVLSDAGAAEDATQDAFLTMWRFAHQVDERKGSPAGWIFTVARTAALQVARRRVPVPVTDEMLGAAEEDPEPEMIDRFWVEGALARLSPPEREALDLSYRGDLSHSQIAAHLGEPLGTVKARIRRALGRLAVMMEEGS